MQSRSRNWTRLTSNSTTTQSKKLLQQCNLDFSFNIESLIHLNFAKHEPFKRFTNINFQDLNHLIMPQNLISTYPG